MTAATYAKLADGTWGLRIQAQTIDEGAKVNVTTQAGNKKTEYVGEIFWAGTDTKTGADIILARKGVAGSDKPSGSLWDLYPPADDDCQYCNGHGFFTMPAHPNDRNFGEAYLCQCRNGVLPWQGQPISMNMLG